MKRGFEEEIDPQPTVAEIDDVMDSDYNPFDDEATARPSVMGYLLGREARGSVRAKQMRAYRTGDLKKPDRKKVKSENRQKRSSFAGFLAMSGVEKLAVILGIITVIAAVSVGTVYAHAVNAERYLEEFATLGTELEGVNTIGGDGLVAIADAQLAKKLAAEQALIDAAAAASQEEEVIEEEASSNDVSVIMTLTTVQSDIKIKFINYDTNRRVNGVPFEILITDPDGNEKIHNDHDKDGIIYLKDLKSGTYKVRMRALPLDYTQYKISTETLSIKVKETIEYKGIDIVDEIKSESEVNVAKEDHKKEETPVESENKNTVEWVESTKREVSPGTSGAITQGGTEYVRVEKSTIPDPFSVALSGSFLRLSARRARTELDVDSSSVTIKTKESATVNLRFSSDDENVKPKADSDDQDIATAYTEKSGDGYVVRISGGTTAGTTTIHVTAGDITRDISVTVEKKEEDPKYTLSLSDSAITLEKDASKTVTATISPEDGSPSLSISSSNNDVATASLDGKSITIKGIAKGEARITVSYAGLEEKIQVTVNETKEPTIQVTPDSAAIKMGESITLAASIEGLSDTGVTWSIPSGNDVVRVDENGKVTGLKEGTATVRGTSKERTDLYDETKITVSVDAAKMNAQLKDKEGREVYIKDGSSYKLATNADYSKYEDFYILTSSSKAYIYTGWQTLDGRTYYFDKNGNKVTGEQVINGAKYNFGSDGALSAGSGNLGIDVSKWNGNIDWTAVRNSGVSFVIIRCGYRGMDTGALIEDPKFRANIQGASSAGLKVGVYFFSQAINEVEAVEEASMAISLCRNYRLTYPIFLDVESGGRANGIGVDMRTKVCKAFCATVSNAGYKAGVYANKTWFNSYINTPELTGYKLWLAQYAAAPSYTRTRYDMWQYSSKGRVSGISGNVDMNISYLGY